MTQSIPAIRPDDQRYDYSDPAHWYGCGEENIKAIRRARQGWRGSMADVINRIEAQHGGVGTVGEGWVARGTMPNVLQQYLASEGIASQVYDVSGPGAFMPRLQTALDRGHPGLWMGRAETATFGPDPNGAGLHWLIPTSMYVDCGQPWGGTVARYSPARMEGAALWYVEIDLPLAAAPAPSAPTTNHPGRGEMIPVARPDGSGFDLCVRGEGDNHVWHAFATTITGLLTAKFENLGGVTYQQPTCGWDFHRDTTGKVILDRFHVLAAGTDSYIWARGYQRATAFWDQVWTRTAARTPA